MAQPPPTTVALPHACIREAAEVAAAAFVNSPTYQYIFSGDLRWWWTNATRQDYYHTTTTMMIVVLHCEIAGCATTL